MNLPVSSESVPNGGFVVINATTFRSKYPRRSIFQSINDLFETILEHRRQLRISLVDGDFPDVVERVRDFDANTH
jgi:hypothetical protein